MEPITIAATAALVTKYVLSAIKHLGDKVLQKSEESAEDAAVGYGKRLLHLLLDRTRQGGQLNLREAALEGGIERRVRAIAEDPGREAVSIQLEGAIEDLLTADSALLASVVELLGRVPTDALQQSDRSSYVGRDNSGTIVTGDGNAVLGR